MKEKLFLTFLTATLIFSQPVLAEESEIEVTYPFIGSGEDVLISNPYLQGSFLDFLEENSVHTVIDKSGIPLLYYSENQSFGCQGICSNISMNNYTLGSSILDVPGLLPGDINESMVFGNRDIEETMDTMNAIRESLGDNPEALSGFESQLLEQQEGFLRGVYFENAYDDVWDYALEEIKKDPEVFGSLMKHIGMKDIGASVGDLEKFLSENFDINSAYDMSSLFSALENRQMGQAQMGEFMRNVLERLSEQQGIDLNLDDIDLEGFSELLDSDEFKNTMEKALEMIEENPEMFEHLKELAEEMLERPETMEVFKEALKEMLEKADWESISKLIELFSKMDNKQQLLEAMMEGATEHMREMAESGMMDEIQEKLNDPELRKMLMEAAQSFSKGILDDLVERIEQTPMGFAYIIAILAVIATLIILMRIKL